MSYDYKTIQEYSLSDTDIRKILGNDIKIIPYNDLNEINNINELFDSKGRSMILFLTENEHTGHWICMIKRGNKIDFFDPYGIKVDNERNWLTKDKLEELGQDKPLLLNLLKGSGYGVYYNTYRFQKKENEYTNNIATCGRHCCARLLFKDIPLNDYAKKIKQSKLTPDEFVSNITFKILKK
jgi:hypothetical protein